MVALLVEFKLTKKGVPPLQVALPLFVIEDCVPLPSVNKEEALTAFNNNLVFVTAVVSEVGTVIVVCVGSYKADPVTILKLDKYPSK